MTYEIGQVVYLAFTGHMRSRTTHAEITKIGRKWVTVKLLSDWGEDRFNKSTGRVDARGYTELGSVWPSEQAYKAHIALGQEWERLRDTINRMRSTPRALTPKHVSDLDTILHQLTERPT